MNINKLTDKEATVIMINLICNKLFILAPLYFKQKTGGAALIVTTLVFAISFILWNLYCRFSNSSIIDLIQTKSIKYCLITIITLISAFVLAATIQQYSYAIKVSVLNNTPLWIITTFFLLTILAGAGSNIKGIGIAGIIFVPLIYISALTMVVFSVPQNDVYNFFPLIDTTNKTIIKNALLMLSMQYELIFLFFLPDILVHKERTKKTGNITILCSYICFLIINIVFSITMPEFSGSNNEPFFRIIRMTHFGNITTNFDSLFLILYCISAYLYLVSMISMVIKILKLTFEKLTFNCYKYTVLAIVFFISLNTFFVNYVFKLLSNIYYALFLITFAFPLIILIKNRILKCKLKN